MSVPRLSLLCLGAGAIGTYIGGSLGLSGSRLVFLEQPDAARELEGRGLRLDLSVDTRRSAKGALVLPPQAVIFARSADEALDQGPFDAAIFALKSFDTPQALEAVETRVGQMPPVVCFSNGVENEEHIGRLLGAGRVVAATVTSAVGRRAAGDIVLDRLRGVGIYSGHPVSDRLLAAANLARLNARGYPNAAAMKWSKMLTNLIANPTSAILNWSAAEVLAHPGIYRLEIGMLRECLAVMKAQHITVVDLPGTPVRALAAAVQLPPWMSKPLISRAAGTGRGAKMPSFHIDLYSRRRKSEVGYLHGAVARFGDKLGVPTPINSYLTRTLQALTDGHMPLERYAGKPEEFLADLSSSIN